MTAKEAKAIAKKRQEEVAKAMEVLKKFEEKTKQDTLQEKAQREIEHWERAIECVAEKGGTYWQIHHIGDELFPIVQAHFSALGYRVHEYTDDGGYCIGDVHMISVSW